MDAVIARNAGHDLLVQRGQRLEQLERAFAWRIDQPFFCRTVAHQHGRRHLEQVARYENCSYQRRPVMRWSPISFIILARTGNQHLAALNAQHFACLGGQRQREVAQAAKPVNHALGWLHVEQAQRTRHQHLVDVRIDLRKVGRLERHGDAKLGQAVAQLGHVRIQQRHGVQPAGLQPPLQASMRRRKRAQLRQIARAQRLHVAQHHRRHCVAAGQLDLRNRLFGIHGANEGAQRQQQVADMLRNNAAFAHVGHVAALALVKAHQHLALFAHIAHRQAGAVAVVPGRPLDGPE